MPRRPGQTQSATPPPAAPVKRGPGRPRLEQPSPEFIARREEILAVAAEVFHLKGYDAGTLDDVAEALDLRRASLYYYVRSKGQLLYMLFERALDIALGRMEEFEKIADPRERIEALIRHQALTIASEPSLFTVFFDHRPRLDERYEAAIKARERRYLEIVRSAVKAATDANVLSVLEPHYAAQALMGMTSWIYKWFDPKRHDAEKFADVCVALLLGPRTASPGRPGRARSPRAR